MRQKNSVSTEQPPVVLRRSPRFLQIIPTDPEDPKTPKPVQKIRKRVPSPETTPHRLTPTKASSRRTRKTRSKEAPAKLKQTDYGKNCDNPESKVRKSKRIKQCADESNFVPNPRKWELEKRVTRSSCLKNTSENYEKTDNGVLSDDSKVQEGSDECQCLQDKRPKKRVKHKKNCSSELDEGVLSIIEKPVLDEGLPEKYIRKPRKRTNGRIGVSTEIVFYEGETEGKGIDEVQKQVGFKRKRNHVEEVGGICQGWTKYQESALERAYFVVKPTPHFWKKVARLVPGKSAQECFDKINSIHLTPPQRQPRSRARKSNSGSPSFSASKLLNSPGPKVKRPRYRKQKSHVVQRTVRNMLEKHYKVEQDSEADLFSVLESTMSPSTKVVKGHPILTTPDCSREKSDLLLRCQERSSTSHRRCTSRFNNSYGTTLVSPPVLKQVKNKALHEKYIDQLHCRDAKRKAVSLKAEKLHQGKALENESLVQRKDAIKAAKNALFFGARDAINEFQHHQAKAMSSSCDDGSGADSDEEEGEDFF